MEPWRDDGDLMEIALQGAERAMWHAWCYAGVCVRRLVSADAAAHEAAAAQLEHTAAPGKSAGWGEVKGPCHER